MTNPGVPIAQARPAQAQQGPWAPPPMRSIEDTGLNLITIADLALKVMYFGGIMTGSRVGEIIKLPYTGVVDQVMEFLKREKYVEVKGQGGLGEASFQFIISAKGVEKAKEILERSQYAGPTPVTLDQYIAAMKAQNRTRIMATPDVMKKALGHLVISETMYG